MLGLSKDDVVQLNSAKERPNGVKAVVGPGTGMGEGYLTKSEYAPFYEIHPAEGGHTDFAVRSEEDFALF